MVENIFKTVTDIFKALFWMIDNVVYGFIPALYELIISLASVDLYNGNPVITALIYRVYIIVGIFMLFKLAFSILHYIVDPGSFSDQSQGFSNLVKRVIIALVLLVSVPWIFDKMYEYQGKILESHVIQNLILGTSDSGMSDLESSAKDVQFLVFGPFYSINYNSSSLNNCTPSKEHPMTNIIGSTDMATQGDKLEGSCLEQFAKLMDNDSAVQASGATIDKYFKMGDVDERDFKELGAVLNLTTDDGSYAVDYKFVFSTICGGYLVFLLLSFCIDIAGRSIKLLFLQLLSPVAIITSVDPKSSSQNDKLKDWASEVLRTYVALFLRLIVVFVVIQMVKIITAKLFAGADGLYHEGFEQTNTVLNIFVYIFLVLGAFSVAKKLPELLEKAFGIKMSGEVSLNPFKNFKENAGFGLMSGAATGAVAGGLSGGVSAFTTSMNHEKGIGRSLLSGAGGMVSGSTTGTFRGGKAKGLKGWEAGMQSGGRIARRMEVRQATGGVAGVPSMAMDRFRDKTGAPTTFESREAKASRYDDVTKQMTEIKSHATDQLSKKSNAWKAIQAGRVAAEQKLKNGEYESQEAYVSDLNKFYNQEQELIANYIDSKGKDFGGDQKSDNEDGQLMLKKQSFVKAVKDTRDDRILHELDADGKVIKDSTGKPTKTLDVEHASWKELGADGALLKTNAEKSALGIRSSDSYNDAKDRHEAIHGARTDAHMKH